MNQGQSLRVFTRETVLRLGLQNRVLRMLRQQGCKVTSVAMDAYLTIAVEPSDAFLRRRISGGMLKRRTDAGYVVCIDVQGCKVVWMEGRKHE